MTPAEDSQLIRSLGEAVDRQILKDYVDKKLREGARKFVLDHGGDHRDLARLGLWCPFCGADTDPSVDHECGPDRVERKGLRP